MEFLLQLDALSPAVDVLIRDLPGSEGSEQSLRVLRAAVQVKKFLLTSSLIFITMRMAYM